MTMSDMFCFQCEQTSKGTGCTTRGVCGKDATVATLQDLLIHTLKCIAPYAHRAHALGASDHEVNVFVIEALFTTVTNVNFDPQRIASLIRKAPHIRDKARSIYETAARSAGKEPDSLEQPASWTPAGDIDELATQGRTITTANRLEKLGPDVAGLQELILYGLKGMAAYADHAQIVGVEDDEVYAFFHEALDYLAGEPTDIDALLAKALQVGEVNLKVMGMLDAANTGAYGHPEPTEVRITPVPGKCILVSGHDLRDLADLLEQSQGRGVNVYTHGEMLPTLAYPGLKKYEHLVGNWGGAWQDQRKEFPEFPGAILMTTNCLQKPADSYCDRMFTSGRVAWTGVKHISDRNFKPVIDAALSGPGFAEDTDEKTITIGFARETVMSVAGKVVEAVKAGKIRHFFLIGGCDGARSGRNYYTQFAEQVPDDCVILTLACGKYRFNKLEFGDIGGIPRLLDCGPR
jgi:hydroxylamine reductase